MKKIDLHIHTVPTFSDSHFIFSLDTFVRYVKDASLDAVAVTNHDLFDIAQFREIQSALDGIAVFPGIEINVEKGHVLIIGNASELDDFNEKATAISQRITKTGDRISVEDLQTIYGDLRRYLVIPHYEKSPAIAGETLEKLKPYVCAGEVDSPKKFVWAIKDDEKLTPVLFSDQRIRVDLTNLPTRQTFIDCGELTLESLKACLRDKAKVKLSKNDGNKLWQAFEDGQQLSTGLNVLIGGRSTGKTHTLNRLSETNQNVKYIRQFALVQQDDGASSERDFKNDVEKERSVFADRYLSGLKLVVDDVMNVDMVANDRAVERYVETLTKAAVETDRRDAFSQATLFDEEVFSIGNTNTLASLIASVQQVLENIEFRPIIEKHLELASLRALICELIELFREKTHEYARRKFVTELMGEIKQGLQIRTATSQVKDVDLYKVSMDIKRVARFSEIVEFLTVEQVIFEQTIQGFKIEARRGPYSGAGEVKATSGLKTVFSEAFRVYERPYEYLRRLMDNDAIPRADLYKLFIKIGYRILNRDGFPISGGERSEFRLLQEIANAQNYDILLIDEPESSFDNLFLNGEVNQILKEISKTMPVVVVTHNSTVGASVGADYVLCTRKELEGGEVVYRTYSGYPSDKKLLSTDGREIESHEIMMNSLEAGVDAYNDRRERYEAIKSGE